MQRGIHGSLWPLEEQPAVAQQASQERFQDILHFQCLSRKMEYSTERCAPVLVLDIRPE